MLNLSKLHISWVIELRMELSCNLLFYVSCMLKFHKWMRCNEKSKVKLSEASLKNGSWNDYLCSDELNELQEVCIVYHYKLLFDMYHERLNEDFFKPVSQQRISRRPDLFHVPTASKKLYY